MLVIILIILFIVGFVWFLKYLDRKSGSLSDSLLAQGLISSEYIDDALSKSVSGVLFTASDGNLNNIFNRLNKSSLALYKIYPKLDLPAGMILFDSFLLTDALIRYVEIKDDVTVFEFRILPNRITTNWGTQSNSNIQGRGGITSELCCNMILTSLKKAIK